MKIAFRSKRGVLGYRLELHDLMIGDGFPEKAVSSGQKPPTPGASTDCGCGCGGNSDCDEAKQPVNRARRSLILGASAGAVFVASTLANRRAFAAQCGPVSHAMSLHPSGSGQQTGCGGLTPGFWKNHIGCAAMVLGFSEPSNSPTYTNDVNNFLTSTTLGSKLSNLSTVDFASAAHSFAYAFCTPNSDANHWACAILNALSPQWNPSYGYTITELNHSILAAFNAGASASSILQALETLENDAGTGGGPGNSTCPNMSMATCSSVTH